MRTPSTTELGTCESAVCVRIEYRIESGVKIRIRIESRIESAVGLTIVISERKTTDGGRWTRMRSKSSRLRCAMVGTAPECGCDRRLPPFVALKSVPEIHRLAAMSDVGTAAVCLREVGAVPYGR